MKGAILFFILASTGIYYSDIFITIQPPTVTTESDFSFSSTGTIPLIFNLPAELTLSDIDSLTVLSGDKTLKFLQHRNNSIRFIADLMYSKDIRIYTKQTTKSSASSFLLNNFIGTNDTIKYYRITVAIPTSLKNFRTNIPLDKETSDENLTLFCSTFENAPPDTILILSW